MMRFAKDVFAWSVVCFIVLFIGDAVAMALFGVSTSMDLLTKGLISIGVSFFLCFCMFLEGGYNDKDNDDPWYDFGD